MTATSETTPKITVVFLLFPGITQLDFTAPAQALSRMPGARLIGAAATLDPIATDSGFAILPTHDFASAPQADILCVPGGHGVTEALSDAVTMRNPPTATPPASVHARIPSTRPNHPPDPAVTRMAPSSTDPESATGTASRRLGLPVASSLNSRQPMTAVNR